MTTRYVDVFNGDADGLCSLHQLRLAEPREVNAPTVLVTGLKREIDLLQRVSGGGDTAVTVLDVSLDRNRAALERLLAAGASVRYFDHHYAGAVPAHPRLCVFVDPAPDICTGILVDRYLGGRQRLWAVVAAFGDNLNAAARTLAAPLGLDPQRLRALRALGEALNYNSYGETADDVTIHPCELYRAMQRFADPFAFHATQIVQVLIARFRGDLAAALALAPVFADARGAVYRLPAAPWSRRVLGSFANVLVRLHPERAHAVVRDNADGTLAVSVRAPRTAPWGADELCRQFETGGGRAAAAGIDRLPLALWEDFLRAFRAAQWRAGATSAP